MLNNLALVWSFEQTEFKKTNEFCNLIIKTHYKNRESYKLIFSVFSLFLTINQRLNRKQRKAINEKQIEKIAFLLKQRKSFSDFLFLTIQPAINNNFENSVIAWEKTFCQLFGFKNIELTKEADFLKKLELFSFKEN